MTSLSVPISKINGTCWLLGGIKNPKRWWDQLSTGHEFPRPDAFKQKRSHLPVKHTFFTHTKNKKLFQISRNLLPAGGNPTHTTPWTLPWLLSPGFAPFFRFRFGLQETDGSQQHHDFFPGMGGQGDKGLNARPAANGRTANTAGGICWWNFLC